MIFGKKNKEIKCDNCKSNIEAKFNFCPYCSHPTIDEGEELKDFGLLGKNDFSRTQEPRQNSQDSLAGLGITDKLINSVMNSMMKSLDKQFKNMAESDMNELNDMNNTHIEQLPNGIKIKIGPARINQNKQPKQKQAIKKQITSEQIEKMSNLPRTIAKTSVRRLSDKIVYELSAAGIESVEDVFISKLEEGYEIKAIGKKKVYVNSLPVNLPLKGYSITDNKLLVEFNPEK